jgi:manganese/iron transport system permease protein
MAASHCLHSRSREALVDLPRCADPAASTSQQPVARPHDWLRPASWLARCALSHILFGNILSVRPADLLLIGVITVGVLLTLALLHKELELTSYDPTYAEVIGLRAERMRTLLLLLLALAVVACIQVVGVILTSALVVTPAAAAALLTDRLPHLMLLAAAIAVGSSLLGLYISFYADLASGAAIVLACTACFGLAWLAHSFRKAR